MIVVALGANLGAKAAETVSRAAEQVALRLDRPARVSVIYRTPAFPAGNGPDFANAVMVLKGTTDPHAVLAACHATEADFGRVRTTRWAPRTLDVDLIAVGNTVLPDAATYARWQALPLDRQICETPDTLILPHPRLAERAFVLVPLAQIAPDWRHPVTGHTAAQMCAALPAVSRAEVVPWTPAP